MTEYYYIVHFKGHKKGRVYLYTLPKKGEKQRKELDWSIY